MNKTPCRKRAVRAGAAKRRRKSAATVPALWRIDRDPWAGVGRSPLGRRTAARAAARPSGLADGVQKGRRSGPQMEQEHFVMALNTKFKGLAKILGIHYRAYCCVRCQEGFVVRRWKAGCVPREDDPFNVAKPIAMSPHELDRWFSTKHHISWSRFLKTPSAKIRVANRVQAKETGVLMKHKPIARAGYTKSIEAGTAAKSAASASVRAQVKKATGTKVAAKKSTKKASVKKAAPAVKKSYTRSGKERTTRQKEARATRGVNYRAIEAELDETLDLLKKHIN